MNSSREYAPIALFVYNRPTHTRLTVEALLRNPESACSSLYVFSDGPKNANDNYAVCEVRKYLSHISGFAEIHIIERKHNWGLANSIIDGVTQLCNQFGRTIVLEDDLETSSYFLAYMNEALERFKDDESVAAVSFNSANPTLDSISDGSYPLSRPLYLYLSSTSKTSKPAVSQYVKTILSDELSGENGFLTYFGLIPNPDLAQVRKDFEEGLGLGVSF